MQEAQTVNSTVEFRQLSSAARATDGAEFIYLFGAGPVTKLGRSRDPVQRLNTIAGASGRAIESAWIAGPYHMAHVVERDLLQRLEEHRVAQTEWFALSVEKLRERLSGLPVDRQCTAPRAARGGLNPTQMLDVLHRNLIALEVVNDQPRARDITIAQRLGFKRPRDIRKLIERNLIELERYGTCATVARVSKGKRGSTSFTEYWLNEEQALLLATLSGTDEAADVREMLIRSFAYFRKPPATETAVRGDLDGVVTSLDPAVVKVLGGVFKGIIAKALHDVLPSMVEAEIASQQYGVVRGLTAGDVLTLAGIENRKGLRGVPRRVSDRLRLFHAEKGRAVNIARLGPRSAYIFDPATAREWLDCGGKASIHGWIAERRGQGVLKLVAAD